MLKNTSRTLFAALVLSAAVLSAASCSDSIGVDVKIDETKFNAEIPDSLVVTIGHTEELYVPIPTYDGHPVTEADVKIDIKARNENIVTAKVVNDSTFAITGNNFGTTDVLLSYGTVSRSIAVTVVDEMITSLKLSVSKVELFTLDTLDVYYEVEPAELINHKIDINISGYDDDIFIYQAYSDKPGHILLRAMSVGTTKLTFTVDTCSAVITAVGKEVLPTGISGGVSGTWSLRAGDADSVQFYVKPDNCTYPELDLILTSWEPEDLYDVPITDASGNTVGTMKSNYAVERDAAGDPVITVGGAVVPYRDSLGNVISYSNAQVSTKCVYTPRIEDYLIFDGHRLNNHKMTALKACSASFVTRIKAHPEFSKSFSVKVTGEKHRYE